MIRAGGAALLAVLLLLVCAAPSGAVLIDQADQAELANSLADAQEAQGVCYSYVIGVTGGPDGVDQGSGAGPGKGPDPAACSRFVVFRAQIDYTCGSCEANDTASIEIQSNLPNPPRESDLADLGLETKSLLGDRDDLTAINMVQALPLIAAERNGLRAVPFEQAANVPAADGPTGQPSSDFWRAHWLAVVLLGVVVLLGIAYFVFQLLARSGERIMAEQAAASASAAPNQPSKEE